ncbi:MAG TPA: site-2 protease family protein [Candidatus Paceibacterota bacterium]
MYIVLFFVILAVLVLVHEFGHFYAAKKSGVRVDEFGLGFPPKLWSKKWNGTEYSLNAVPFGGFVKIFGENPDEESISGPDSARSFVKKPKWIQVIILAAGIIMNVVFAWLLFSIAFMSGMTMGVSESVSKYITESHVIIVDTLPNSPSARAGLLSGDEILSFSTASSTAVSGRATSTASTVEAFQMAAKNSNGKPIGLEIMRLTGNKYIEVVPEKGVTGDNYAIGISMDMVGKAKLPFFMAFWEGAKLTYTMFGNIAGGIATLIKDAVVGDADVSQLSGPVGIARLVGDAAKFGFVYLLSFTAFISLNLAVLNLVPFPALDGGRILFVIIEAIIRRPISPKVANTLNAVGFCLLILFMLFVTYKDIVKIF